MRVYNEHSGNEYTCWFESVPGVPTVPTTVHWRLRNVSADQILQDWTELTPEIVSDESGITGVKTTIDINGQLNVLFSRSARRETFELQVVADKDDPREYSKFHQYAVANGGQR